MSGAPEGDQPLAVAVSGGGVRATLFALGALMAMVDRGLNRRVTQIASVSGGLIANAFVAQHCRFDELAPGGFDPIAAALAARLMNPGILTRRHIALALSMLVMVGAVVAAGVAQFAPLLIAVIAGLIAALSGLLGFGRYVEARIKASVLQIPGPFDSLPSTNLGDLGDRSVEHVFCATDLVLGAPVYFSTAKGGVLWRRTGTSRGMSAHRGSHPAQRWDAGPMRLAGVVRASAAFPGIPPRRLRLDPERTEPNERRPSLSAPKYGFGGVEAARAEQLEIARHSPPYCFLSDGGLWNNLGTQALREDGFYLGEHVTPPGTPKQLLSIDASASLRTSPTWTYLIPGVSVLSWLLRSLQLLYENSVAPRRNTIQGSLSQHIRTLDSEGQRMDLLVDLGPVDTMVEELENLAGQAGWPAALADFIRPELGIPVTRRPAWDDNASAADGDVTFPTTLDRVPVNMARRLIARGYLNTWLTTALIQNPEDPDIELLDTLRRRVAAIAPSVDGT